MATFRQLQYFMALGEHLHFGHAAASQHVTQPPFSRQIAALEEEIGVQLVARTSRSVELTLAGSAYLAEVRQIMQSLDAAAHTARSMNSGEAGTLRIGFTMAAAWTILPEAIRRYSERWPGVNLVLEEKMPHDLQRELREGGLDVGISFGRPDAVRNAHEQVLHYVPLYREKLCMVLPASHRLASRKKITLSQLADEPFITFPADTAPILHEAIMHSCAQAGFTPQVRLETHLQQTIVNLVAAGLGVSLVPASMSRMRLDGAVFVALAVSPDIEQGVSWHPARLNPCIAAFVKAQTALA